MSKLNKVEELKTKRFVIRKSLIGKNVVITFVNKKVLNVLIIMMKSITRISLNLITWNVSTSIKVIQLLIIFQLGQDDSTKHIQSKKMYFKTKSESSYWS